jgi:DNA-binding MarR family transcriptional regulator
VTLRRAARAMTALYDSLLADTGLTLPQFSMLRALQRLGTQPMSRLAEEVRLDRTTLTRNLRLLHRRRWIEIHRGADQRQRTVSLTRAGESVIARAVIPWSRAQATVEVRLGPERLRTLREALVELETLAG